MIHIPLLTNATANTTSTTIDLPTTAGGAITPLAEVTVKFEGGDGEVVVNTGMVASRIAPIKDLIITKDCSFQVPIGHFASVTVQEYESGNIYVDLGVDLK